MRTPEGQPSGPAVTVALGAIGGLGTNSIETEARLLIVVRAGYSLRAEAHRFVAYAQPLDVSLWTRTPSFGSPLARLMRKASARSFSATMLTTSQHNSNPWAKSSGNSQKSDSQP